MRSLLMSLAVAGLFAGPAMGAEIGEDGLHKQEWFTMTFRDVAEDIEQARSEGKRLAITFEQRGCIYCAQMHEKLLTDPDVRSYLEENFMIVQYNMFGDEEVTDLDGEVLTEKTAARKWGYVFTPTIVFLPEELPAEAMAVRDAAVATMPGAFGKWTFLNMFRWVNEKGYETDEHFQTYHARVIQELRVEGRLDAEE